jgi:hypothetical protein
MGWTFLYSIPADPKAELDGLFTCYTETCTYRVLKSSMVGTVYYAAVKKIKVGEPVIVFGAVCLTKRGQGQWGYKDMDESMGPDESKCPIGILRLLTPTDSEWANAWRTRCLEHASRPKIERHQGDVVEFGPSRYRLESPRERGSWLVSRQTDGKLFRMGPRHLNASQSIGA